MSSFKRIGIRIGIIVCLLLLIGYTAFQVSPWPGILIIRYAFNKGAEETNQKLSRHVPPGITENLNIRYDNHGMLLDVYHPTIIKGTSKRLPVIVWIHGGGLVSGNKLQVGNYCKILASKGFTVVSIDYTLAPEAQYPTPLIQTQAALAYLNAHAEELHIDTNAYFLAGDSGGSLIAIQAGHCISDSAYARLLQIKPALARKQLAGLIVYCGIYETQNLTTEGAIGWFMHTVQWAYSGHKHSQNLPLMQTLSILNYLKPGFPPCFISAGNADPLLMHSKRLAQKLSSLKVPVDTLFYAGTTQPALPHEYQFNLDDPNGELALQRSLLFIEHQLIRDSAAFQ